MQDTCANLIRCGVIMVDAQSYIILDSNPAATDILGWQKDELVGRPCQAFICPQEPGKCPLTSDKPLLDNQECTLLSRRGTINIHKSVIRTVWNGRECFLESFVDISHIKSSEESLKESEQNFRQFFNTVDDLIFVADPQGKIYYTNTAVSQKLGYDPKELEQMHVLDVHPQRYRDQANDIFAAMFRGERDYCPLPLETKSGYFLPVETRVWFGKWAGQDCIYGLSKDLTKLHAALEKFEKLFENNPALMAVSGIPDRRFYEVNNAFLDKLGYTKHEVLGKSARELNLFVQPNIQEMVATQLSRFGKVSNVELKVRSKDGRELDGLFSGEVIDNQGVKSFLTVMTDISEIKELEREKQRSEELRQTRDFLENLLKNANASIIVLDANLYIIRVNPAFESLIGSTSENLVGRNLIEFLPAECGNTTIEHIKSRTEKRSKEAVELAMMCHDGSPKIMLWNFAAMALPDGCNDSTLIAQGQDITDRKQMEQALAEKMHETAQLNLKLQVEIANQLHTEQQLRLLSHKLHQAEENQRRKIAAYLHDEIIQNLVYANIKLGECRNSSKDQGTAQAGEDIQRFLQKTIKELRTLTFELGSPILYELGFIPAVNWLIREYGSKHAFNIELAEVDFPASISEQQGIILFQILRELLTNIIKYARADHARILLQATPRDLKMVISDNGVGFDINNIKLDVDKNSGFGLVNIRERLHNLGGTIKITSKIGQGTAVQVRLPRETSNNGTDHEN